MTTTLRRRVLRPAAAGPQPDPRREVRQQRRRARLTRDRAALKRWLTRLKRATHTVTELHQRIVRLEGAMAADC
jgi:hypothetical protein